MLQGLDIADRSGTSYKKRAAEAAHGMKTPNQEPEPNLEPEPGTRNRT